MCRGPRGLVCGKYQWTKLPQKEGLLNTPLTVFCCAAAVLATYRQFPPLVYACAHADMIGRSHFAKQRLSLGFLGWCLPHLECPHVRELKALLPVS